MKRYIKTITLKNFQSYKNQVIHCKPGLNLLIGTSDSGKSAILRAISFVLYNYPKRDSLIHWGAKETEVTLEFSDGLKVTRVKGESKNDIIAIKPDGKEIKKTKIDSEIPDEIKELLGNPPKDDFNGLISYSDQFSKLFLIDLSPSDLPRSLSNLTGVSVLEDSAKYLMSSYKAIEKQTKNDEKEYKNLIEEIQSYSFVQDYESKVDDFSDRFDSLIELENKIDEFTSLIDGINLEVDKSYLKVLTDLITKIETATKSVKDALDLSSDLQSLQLFNLLNDQSFDENCISSLESIITKAENQIVLINNQKENLKTVESLNDCKILHEKIKEHGQKLSDDYKKIANEITQSEKNLKEFKQFLIDENIQCEVCGSVLK
jgi:chromosome segregation ATPase